MGPRRRGRPLGAWLGIPGGTVLRKELREAHEAYLAEYSGTVMARGPSVTDDAETPIGSVILLDVPAMGAARAFMEKEPFCSNGVYQEVTFQRWRFGRVMDRFKNGSPAMSGVTWQ